MRSFALAVLPFAVVACGSSDASPPDARSATSIDAASAVADAMPASEFRAEFCDQVAGTLNIHWEAVAGDAAPCTGIEFTDGDVGAATAGGSVSMSGTSVSDANCIGTASYDLVLAKDGLSLTGSDTVSNIPMTLTRLPGEACFVGHWVDAPHDYVAHISAAAFGLTP